MVTRVAVVCLRVLLRAICYMRQFDVVVNAVVIRVIAMTAAAKWRQPAAYHG